jgi:hypothetical protein
LGTTCQWVQRKTTEGGEKENHYLYSRVRCGAVVEGGMSRNAAAKRFGISIASGVRWVARFSQR